MENNTKRMGKGSPRLTARWRSLSIACICMLIVGVTAICAFAFRGPTRADGGIGNQEPVVRAEIEADKPVIAIESAQKTISHRRGTLIIDVTIVPNGFDIRTLSIDVQYDKTLFQYNEAATMEGMWDIENPYFADGFTVGVAKDSQGILKVGGMAFDTPPPVGHSIVGSLVFDIKATNNAQGEFEIIDFRLPVYGTAGVAEVPSGNIFDCTIDLVFADTLELKPASNVLQFVDKDGVAATRTPAYVYSQDKQHYMVQMAEGTKLSQLESQFLVSDYLSSTDLEIKFFSAAGTEISNTATTNVETGMSVQLFSDDILLDKVIIVVRGDVNGDGLIDVVDVNLVFNRFNSGTKLTDAAQELAARVRGTMLQTPNMTDVTRIFNHGFAVDGYNLYATGYFGTI